MPRWPADKEDKPDYPRQNKSVCNDGIAKTSALPEVTLWCQTGCGHEYLPIVRRLDSDGQTCAESRLIGPNANCRAKEGRKGN